MLDHAQNGLTQLSRLVRQFLFPDHTALQGSEHLSIGQIREIYKAQGKADRLIKIAGLTFLVLLVWAAVAQVPQSAIGESKVIPSQKLQIVQAVDGGVITAIQVHEGDLVKAGQTLVQIDTTRFNSSVREKEAIEASLTLREARLIALLNHTDMKVPEDMKSQYPDLYAQETKLLNSKLQEWNALNEINEQQLTQKQQEMEEAESRARAAASAQRLADQELSSMRPLLKSGAVSPVEILRIEKDVASAKGDFQAATAQSARLRAAITEAREKIKETRLKLENQARADLAETKGKLKSLAQNQIELSDRVKQATLRAPVDGLIQRILYNTRGAVVPAGKEIVEIVPVDEQLVFETRIKPKDIAFIRPGQKATIRVTAYDSSIFGAIHGKVESISADSLSDDYGKPYYAVKVTAPRTGMNPAIKLIPGMVADVNIETQQRSVLSYLTQPILRASSKMFTEK
ncbi:MAG TPA: HlyD family type I secretion periplasmic adaptor subunit [Limnobacter sp.]|uniref:HlyD family type I secretion periplasmic adaptor subunit n=1 Tax=Limnobacter sp. TaxID=2003368 RepID=UPI002E3138C0|nr:HlyD family type I secretion periplasmic adaptor subunit [Limnobacter sp.]HEX5484704.1 HlyD family type I secretion periplasmic adaptor subunit [Limnobacter sp.]